MIRNFVYLDSAKLRSLSSQVFEGVTESFLNLDAEENSKSDQQKGPFSSGHMLADIFKQVRSSTELRFLEDHAYTLFETKVSELGCVDISTDEPVPDFPKRSIFFKVSGPLKINDTKATTDLMSDFNKFGLALYRSIHHNNLEANALGKPVTDKDIERLARAEGMQMDSKFLSALHEVIRFGFKGMLEVQIIRGGHVFSAPLKRDSLRESEELIVQKYSRISECDFTIFGIATQVGNPNNKPSPTDVKDSGNLKQALRSMSDHMRVLEDSFSGVDGTETVLDPIAIYQIV